MASKGKKEGESKTAQTIEWLVAELGGLRPVKPSVRSAVLFVGAGPGSPELITVAGSKALKEADLIVTAGSLVNAAIVEHWKKSEAAILDSAFLSLPEIAGAMIKAHRAGLKVVRLHTGDPSLYGAIGEQMDILQHERIPYKVIPGVTAAMAAAASFQLELTLPDLTQTLILTRTEGRTPMPPGEDLESLCAHRASLALYLSASQGNRVQKALSDAYGADSTLLICQKVAWLDERIIPVKAKDLSATLISLGIDRHALILAGPAVESKFNPLVTPSKSKLYDPGFSHGYRQASKEPQKKAKEEKPAKEKMAKTPAAKAPKAKAPKAAAPPKKTPPKASPAEKAPAKASPAKKAPAKKPAKRPRRRNSLASGYPSALAVYALTRAGMRLAEKIAKALEADLFAPIKHKGDFPQSEPFHKLGETLERNFAQYEGHVIVAATGLVVRLIAPLLDDKSKDPAVVALGQDGRYVISLLSGHLGGANDLARSVAVITGGRAVVTTATDLASVPAMEMLARDLGLIPESLKPLSAVSGALVDGERAQLYDPGAFLWPHLSNWPELFERMESDNLRPPAIRVDYRGLARQEGVLVLRPPALALGVGCHKEAKSFELEDLITQTLKNADMSRKSVSLMATIDSRAQESMAPKILSKAWGLPLASYDREALASVDVPNPSETVKKNIGVPSVCEAAAILAARGGPLAIPKTKGERTTCALALINWT